MEAAHIVAAWGKILRGYAPTLAIEITRECPLRCPGCYAYNDEHLGGGITLREVRDFKGQELVERFLAIVDRHRPVHVSIVGGEPLVRYRELNAILPALSGRGIHAQIVTSAVREIPREWSVIHGVSLVVSIDGLAAEHDVRRAPATYERILKHIAGHQITVHCTITRQQVRRPGYLDEFLRFWSAREETKRVWFSLYTPQIGEVSDERLTPDDRSRVIADLTALRLRHPKLQLPLAVLKALGAPPQSPDECIFARTTASISADLQTRVLPCQLGGSPDCSNCGCIASAGLEAVGRHALFGLIPVGSIFRGSVRVGDRMRRLRPESAAAAL